MVQILYTRFQQRLNENLYRQYMSRLPVAIQSRIERFHFWQDAQRSLFGNLLLIEGLKEIGLPDRRLDNLRYTQYNRPYLEGIDFNISHSGEFVICAISQSKKVGIDVEEIKEIPVEEFTEEFSAIEMAAITKDKSFKYFYMLWTQKEAFLKAIGKGLNIPLNKVSIDENKIRWENKDWYLHEIQLDAGYASHLCTEIASPTILLKEKGYTDY
jgi:4'-phosphopantetheinyl transferase